MDPDRARELLERERGRIERALADLAPEDSGEISDIDTHLGDEASDLCFSGSGGFFVARGLRLPSAGNAVYTSAAQTRSASLITLVATHTRRSTGNTTAASHP